MSLFDFQTLLVIAVTVNVSVDPLSGDKTTSLGYQHFDYSAGIFIMGSGQIPNDAFHWNGSSGHAELDIDTSTVSGFLGIPTGGRVQFSWAPNGVFTERAHGSGFTTTACCGTFRSSFQSSRYSADAGGTLLGTAVDTRTAGPFAGGSVFQTRNQIITH